VAINPICSAYFPVSEKKHVQPMSYWVDRMADLRENYGSTSSQKYDSVDQYLQQFDETKQDTVRLIFKVMASKYRNLELAIVGNHPFCWDPPTPRC
jgi:hypothetical protein